ncbi:MAG: type II toxin-antitoxin system death-on-curing family toxin [Coriobacteriia bacterium]|nr:type II toxin-antitoxin system death-on-curing family toxin [Coriobacteriia bacterium]MDI6843257.1 type II toxin-antitoxin system death-on-curing family toxin [Anaerosomatales bacterium]
MTAERHEPRWLSRLVVDAIQHDTIATHGGLPGLRDEDALESALARPRHRFAYGETTDVAELGAAYGYSIARNHPYVDGNKRTAFLAMVVFVELNGLRFKATEADVVDVMLRLAAGEIQEADLADWLRERTAERA